MKLKNLIVLLISVFIYIPNYAAPSHNAKQMTHYENYLLFGVPNRFGNLDPIKIHAVQTMLVLPLVYETLVGLDKQKDLEPLIANSWQVDNSRKKVILTLKKKYLFSNGKELTAKDVMHSINRVCSSSSDYAIQLAALKGCNAKNKPSVHIIGKYKLSFGITDSPTIFLYELSNPAMSIVRKEKNKLIGTGPYVFEHVAAKQIILRKNKRYFYRDRVKNPGIIIRYMDENHIDRILKNNHHIDGSVMYRYSAFHKIENKKYYVIRDAAYITQLLVFNLQRFPFNKVIVRKALAANLYNKFPPFKCLYGAKKPYGIIPYGTGGSIANMAPKVLQHIPDEEVFSKVPQLKGRTINVTIHQHIGRKNVCLANAIKNAAKEYNINIRFKYHNTYKELSPLYFNHHLDGFVELFLFFNRDAYRVLSYFTKNKSANFDNTDNNKVDEMLQKALSMPASFDRFKKYQKINKYITSNAFVIPLYYVASSDLVSKCLAGVSENFYYNPFKALPFVYKKAGCKFN